MIAEVIEHVTVDESSIETADQLVKALERAFKDKPSAVVLFSREFFRRMRRLKLADGEYLWWPGYASRLETIAGRRFDIMEDLPFAEEVEVAMATPKGIIYANDPEPDQTDLGASDDRPLGPDNPLYQAHG